MDSTNVVMIREDRSVKVYRELIGMTQENLANTLAVVFDFDVTGKDVYFEFEKADRSKRSTEALEAKKTESGWLVSYDVPRSWLNVAGALKIQAVLRDEHDKVWKSFVWKHVIKGSINASDFIEEENPDFIIRVQKLLEEIKENNNKIASSEEAGMVKIGEEFTVDEDGTLHLADGVASTTNYEDLENLPSINGVTLSGDMTLEDIGIEALSDEEIEELLLGGNE